MNEVLNEIYQDLSNPAGLGGVQSLYREGKKRIKHLTLRDVKTFLQGNRTYTLHKSTRKRFPRRKIIAAKPRVIITCDLGDFAALQKHNGGVKYILFCVDVFSRYLQVATLKNKSAQSTLIALKTILESEKSAGVSRMFTDEGSEFYNKKVKEYLASKRMSLYSTFSRETKASMAERTIKTLKGKIYKHLTLNNTLTYINVLPTMVATYNHTPHGGLGEMQTPAEVHQLRDLRGIRRQFRRMYLNQGKVKKTLSSTLAIGDTVRLQLLSRTQYKFTKGYKINNTEELFEIREIDHSQEIPVYYISDLAGEEVKGVFYREELIKTSLPEHYQVDVLKSKLDQNGKRKYLVHWRGYPDKFDSWIDASDFKTL